MTESVAQRFKHLSPLVFAALAYFGVFLALLMQSLVRRDIVTAGSIASEATAFGVFGLVVSGAIIAAGKATWHLRRRERTEQSVWALVLAIPLLYIVFATGVRLLQSAFVSPHGT